MATLRCELPCPHCGEMGQAEVDCLNPSATGTVPETQVACWSCGRTWLVQATYNVDVVERKKEGAKA